MRFSTLVFAAFAAFASATSVSDLVKEIPSCALTCLATASVSVGCGITDFECQCKFRNKFKISASATPCVLEKCPIADGLKVMATTTKICIAVHFGKDEPEEPCTTGTTQPSGLPTPSLPPSASVPPSATPTASVLPRMHNRQFN